MDKFTVFDPQFNDEDLENKFNDFFYKYNLAPLFTNEHRSSPIKVGYLDAKGVANENGSYVKDLKDFSDMLSQGNDNQRYEEATFKVLQKSPNFNVMMRKVRKLIQEYKSTKPEHLFNFWNIVYYNKDLI